MVTPDFEMYHDRDGVVATNRPRPSSRVMAGLPAASGRRRTPGARAASWSPGQPQHPSRARLWRDRGRGASVLRRRGARARRSRRAPGRPRPLHPIVAADAGRLAARPGIRLAQPRPARRRRPLANRRASLRPWPRAAGSSTSSQTRAGDVEGRRLARSASRWTPSERLPAAVRDRRPDRRGQRRRGAEQAGVDRVEPRRASCRSARSRRPAPVSTLVASSMSSSGPARSRSTASISAGRRRREQGRDDRRIEQMVRHGQQIVAGDARRARQGRYGRWASPSRRCAPARSRPSRRQVREEGLEPRPPHGRCTTVKRVAPPPPRRGSHARSAARPPPA